MYLHGFTSSLLLASGLICSVAPLRGEDPPTKIELVYSGERLEKFRMRFLEVKFESEQLTAVMNPKAKEYETLILHVARPPRDSVVTSIKVSATKTGEFPPKASVVKSLSTADRDFTTIMRIAGKEFDQAMKPK